jgi:DNA-binding transcriptional ArsR family regulator
VLENRSALDLTVGRSTVRQAILALLMDEPGSRLHLREIQRRAETSPGTASRELAKLVAAGLVEREAEGAQVYFRASNSPFATMLRSILLAMPSPEPGPRPRRVPRPARTSATVSPTSGTADPTTATIASSAPIAATTPRRTDEAKPTAVAAAPAPLLEAEPHPAPRVFEPVPRQRAQAPSVPVEGETDAPAAGSMSPNALGLKVASRFAEAIKPIYGDQLRGVYLYGARAAGPADADADVETIVVLDRVDHYGAELEKTSQLCASLSHQYGVLLSRVFVSETAWEGGPDRAAPAVRSEAVAV